MEPQIYHLKAAGLRQSLIYSERLLLLLQHDGMVHGMHLLWRGRGVMDVCSHLQVLQEENTENRKHPSLWLIVREIVLMAFAMGVIK